MTDSPRMVQLTGTTMWAPLLLGGALGGVFADRFDRLRTIQWQLAALVPMVVLVGLLEVTGQLSVWMIYPFLLFAGIGWVGDMTSRRALVFEVVGTQRLDNAMAYEAFALASGKPSPGGSRVLRPVSDKQGRASSEAFYRKVGACTAGSIEPAIPGEPILRRSGRRIHR